MTSKPTILALYPIQKTIPNYNYLIENFNIVYYELTTPENFINDMKNEPFKSTVAIFGSYPGFKSIGGLMSQQIIDSLPENLKIIGLSSVGYDGYNLQSLSKRNIKLCNVPVDKYVAMDVADTALWHVLSGVRKFNSWDRIARGNPDFNTLKLRDIVRNDYVSDLNARQSGFAFGHMFHGRPISRTFGKKCVVLGYGLIGKEVVSRMLTIGMDVNVLVRDKSKYIQDENGKISIYSTNDLDDIYKATKNADVIIVCLPGGSETSNFVSSDLLENLNDNSIVVNVGRGSCIDSDSLKRAVESGKVSHVGLDVFAKEPLIEKYWLDENLTNASSNPYFTSSVTPHLGSSTVETIEAATYECIKNIINGIEHNEFINVVNEL